jgi:hypothetical protein
MSSYKRPRVSIGQSSHCSHNSVEGNGSKGASNINLTCGHLKDTKADFNSPSKPYNFDKIVKTKKATSSSKSYASWNKTKARLTEDEFNKRRQTNACINCGEDGHKSSNCPKPKPSPIESVIDSTIPITRTLVPKLSFAINESFVAK